MQKAIPEKQYAIQLIGPDELVLNSEKPVDQPCPYQILAKVDAVGLCFSDLKLLKQFGEHARKSKILEGMDPAILSEIPSYRPDSEPTVPGHETFATIVAIGDKVQRHTPGQRVLVQTDYRWLPTAKSNGSFGYNFEGGLQQYVLLDERVIVEPSSNESFLIPVEKDRSASSIALVEPWACVESSYITEERNTILPGGKLLVVADAERKIQGLAESFSGDGKSASITVCCEEDSQLETVKGLGVDTVEESTLNDLPHEVFDDIVYFGSSKETIELLNDKLAAKGVINIVLDGRRIGDDVSVGVGRTHYGLTRWIGTTGASAAESYKNIPATGDIRDGDNAIVIGAGGPMGQMHVIRLICSGFKDISVTGTDFDDERLESLGQKADAMARENGVELSLVNPKNIQLFCDHGSDRCDCGSGGQRQHRGGVNQCFRRNSRYRQAGPRPGHIHCQRVLHVRNQRVTFDRYENCS